MNHALTLVGALLALWLVWKLMAVLLLVFAAIILAIAIWSISEPLVRLLHVPRQIALLVVLLFLAAVAISVVFFFGVYFTTELLNLLDILPNLINQFGRRVGISDAGELLSSWAQQFIDGGMFSNVAGYTLGIVSGATGAVVVLFGGAFLALGAESYREGALLLVSRKHRDPIRRFFREVVRSLRLWLLGQLIAMVVVGLACGAGLYFLGVPSWLALGLLAGLLEFVPFIGALLAYAAAVLVALSVDTWLALWVTLLFVGIQQVESNLLVPIVQKKTVALQPALGLFAIIAVGALAGPIGVLLAVPLTLVALLAVRRFYVEGVLGERMGWLGEDDDNSI